MAKALMMAVDWRNALARSFPWKMRRNSLAGCLDKMLVVTAVVEFFIISPQLEYEKSTVEPRSFELSEETKYSSKLASSKWLKAANSR